MTKLEFTIHVIAAGLCVLCYLLSLYFEKRCWCKK